MFTVSIENDIPALFPGSTELSSTSVPLHCHPFEQYILVASNSKKNKSLSRKNIVILFKNQRNYIPSCVCVWHYYY